MRMESRAPTPRQRSRSSQLMAESLPSLLLPTRIGISIRQQWRPTSTATPRRAQSRNSGSAKKGEHRMLAFFVFGSFQRESSSQKGSASSSAPTKAEDFDAPFLSCPSVGDVASVLGGQITPSQERFWHL